MRPAIALSLVWAGCVQTIEVEIPVPADARALILAILPGGALEPRLYAIDPNAAPFSKVATLDSSATLVLFAYTRTPAELGIIEGELVRAASNTPSRTLPAADHTLQRRGTDPWAPLDGPLDPVLANFLIAAASETCVGRGGCYVGGSCTIPCPAPPVPAPPAPPIPPEIPSFTCPPRWASRGPLESGAFVCAPPAPITCTASAAQFLGDDFCKIPGSPCPAGEYPENLPAGPVRYVNSSAQPGGTGSIADPHRTITEALAVAAGGDLIAIAKGEYVENIILDQSLELRGACSAETFIRSPATASAITFRGTHAIARDLAFGGGDLVVRVEAGAHGELRGVRIRAPGASGLFGDAGSTITASELVVRAQSSSGMFTSGSLALERTIVEDNGGSGIALNGADASLTDVIVRREQSAPLVAGFGATIHNSRVVIERALFAENRQVGVFIDGTSTATLTDTIISDTILSDGRPYGIGLELIEGTAGAPNVKTTRLLLERNGDSGIFMRNSNAHLVDTVILHSTWIDPAGTSSPDGSGVRAYQSRVRVEKLVVEDFLRFGLYLSSSTVAVDDATLIGSHSEVDLPVIGAAIDLEIETKATLNRVQISDPPGPGLLASSRDMTIDADSLYIRDVHPSVVALPTDGITFYAPEQAEDLGDPIHLTMTRVLIEDVEGAGVLAYGIDGTIDDLEIRDTRGRGLELEVDAQLTVNRARLVRNRGLGVLLKSDFVAVRPAKLVARDLSIEDTRVGLDNEGLNMSIEGRSIAMIDRFVFSNPAFAAVFVDRMGLVTSLDADLSNGKIVAPIAFRLLYSDYDLARLLDRVLVEAGTPIIRE